MEERKRSGVLEYFDTNALEMSRNIILSELYRTIRLHPLHHILKSSVSFYERFPTELRGIKMCNVSHLSPLSLVQGDDHQLFDKLHQTVGAPGGREGV